MDTTGPSPRIVCVFAMPRTGTRQVYRLFRSLDGVTAHSELFNTTSAFSLRRSHIAEIGRRIDMSLPPDRADPDTVAAVRSNPGVVLDVVADAAAPDLVSLKIFGGHLDRALVAGEVLSRGDLVPIVLRRRLIDSYASWCKAQAVDVWWGQDTTEVEVRGDIDQFARWLARYQRWYGWCTEAIVESGRPLVLMTYEDHIEPGSVVTRAFIDEVLDDHGIDITNAPHRLREGRRQDSATDPAAKFANWTEFATALTEADLLELALGYAV